MRQQVNEDCHLCLLSLVRLGCIKCLMLCVCVCVCVCVKGGLIRLSLNHWIVARSSHHPQKLSGVPQR